MGFYHSRDTVKKVTNQELLRSCTGFVNLTTTAVWGQTVLHCRAALCSVGRPAAALASAH